MAEKPKPNVNRTPKTKGDVKGAPISEKSSDPRTRPFVPMPDGNPEPNQRTYTPGT